MKFSKLKDIKFVRRMIMKIFLGVVIAISLIGGCDYTNKRFGLSDDNIIEEAVEAQIDELTGVYIDLSPRTPE